MRIKQLIINQIPTRTKLYVGVGIIQRILSMKFTFLTMACCITFLSFAAGGNITYVLNGGVTNNEGWKDKNDMYRELNDSWNAYSGQTTTWTPLDTLIHMYGSALNSVSKGIPTNAATMNLFFIQDAAVAIKWQWLVDYMDAVCTTQKKTLPSFNAAYLRYNLSAFFLNSVRATWPATADYTVAGEPSAFMPAWKHGFAGPATYDGTTDVVIPDPYKEEYTFNGWYATSNFSGNKITSIAAGSEGDKTLYAKWVEYNDSTNTEIPFTANFVHESFLNRILFLNQSSGDVESYRWDFGDGSDSSEENPLHIYTTPGIYTVKLFIATQNSTDSTEQVLVIPPINECSINDTITLNKETIGLKNFSNLNDILTTCLSVNIPEDIIIHTVNNQQFDATLSPALNQTLLLLQQKLQQTDVLLKFTADSANNKPVINFTGIPTQVYITTILEFAKHISLHNVVIALNGFAIDITKLNDYQIICSGSSTSTINLSEISPSLPVTWTLNTQPSHTTGFLTAGSGSIPEMTLINNSSTPDTLIYDLQLQTGVSTVLIGQYHYFILPQLHGEISNLSPTGNEIRNSTIVDFSWEAVPNTVYELYLWNFDDSEPSLPLVNNLIHPTYSDSSFCKPDKKYKWKVIARGVCNAIESKTDSFGIRGLVDFSVRSISLPEKIITGRKATISATVINSGENADPEAFESWTDQLYISRDTVFDKTRATLLASCTHTKESEAMYFLHKIREYTVDFQITIPSDTLNYYRFFVETDALQEIPESNNDNNITSGNWIRFAPDIIIASEYQILKDFYLTHSGANWIKQWETGSQTINATNWPDVSFEEGHVTAISLPSNNISGDFPAGLFSLPEIKQINLSDNKLTDHLNSSDLVSIRANKLTSLNLGRNLLEEIPDLIYSLSGLQTLILESNKILTIKSALPKHITTLVVENQTLAMDSTKLSLCPELILPSVCRYDHSKQSFDFYPPLFSLLLNDSVIGHIDHNDEQYHLSLNNPNGWIYQSGQPLFLRQESGLLYGSTATFSFTFPNGDANIDQVVNVLDIQHELNFILEENPYPFNFYASDLYRDNRLTVQDIVSTVNLILNSDTVTESPLEIKRQKIKETINNTLQIRNGVLTLHLATPVSAMDISISDSKADQIRLLLNSNDFQIKTVDKQEYVRFVIFSPTGAEIPTGETAIAEIQSSSPSLKSALLSSKQARVVPAKIIDQITDLYPVDYTNSLIQIYNNQINLMLYENLEDISVSIYNPEGILLQKHNIGYLSTGNHTLDYIQNLPAGIYIIKFNALSGNIILNKNIKFIVAK